SKTARADTNTLDPAVDDRAHDLEIRLEPPRAHVVRVAVLSTNHRRLSTHFTHLCHNSPTHEFANLPISSRDDQARLRRRPPRDAVSNVAANAAAASPTSSSISGCSSGGS